MTFKKLLSPHTKDPNMTALPLSQLAAENTLACCLGASPDFHTSIQQLLGRHTSGTGKSGQDQVPRGDDVTKAQDGEGSDATEPHTKRDGTWHPMF